MIAATVLGAVLEGSGVSGATDAPSQISQAVAAGYIATYSREQETQADELGAEYLARNRYNPQNMVDVIRVLKSQERLRPTRPRPRARGAVWRQLAVVAPQQRQAAGRHPQHGRTATRASYADDGRARYLQAIDGMTFGESREQGVTRGRNFYHEDLGIALTAPQGWQVQNAPDAIVLVNGAGDAGLIVRLVPPKAGSTHEEIIRNVVKPTEGRASGARSTACAATHFDGTRRNDQGQSQAVRLTLVTGPAKRNYLLQYAAKDAAALQRAGRGDAGSRGRRSAR